jgi:hypothetical protein
MDEDRFWSLIDETRSASGGDPDRHAELLEDALAGLQLDEIAAFDRLFREKRVAAYRWDLWAAAYVINGGCSDDCFEYFRNFLIGCGRATYETALRDPDALADLDLREDAVDAEMLGYAAMKAYERATGAEYPIGGPHDTEPAGEPWDEEGLDRVVPRLAAKHL